KTNHEHTLYVRYVFRKRLIFAERWSGKGFLPLASQRTDQGCSGGRTVDPVRRKKARVPPTRAARCGAPLRHSARKRCQRVALTASELGSFYASLLQTRGV